MFEIKLILLSILLSSTIIFASPQYNESNTIGFSPHNKVQKDWGKNIEFILELPLKDNSWGYTHPFIDSEVTYYETETGSFQSKTLVKTRLELSKKYFGLGTGVGFFPAIIKVDKTEELYKINSIFAELEALFYPFGSTNRKITPTLSLGFGGAISSGSIDTSALFYSLGASLNSFFTKRVGASLSVNNRFYTFDEIPLEQNITGDIKFNNYSLKIGLIYAFN